MYQQIAPLPSPTVKLRLVLRKGDAALATVYHGAYIDLPDPAGKFNTFSLPGSSDWIDMFTPHDNSDQRIFVAGDHSQDNNNRLYSLYRARDKKGYAKLMLSLFKQADNIVVTLDGDRPVVDVKWPEYYFKVLREACNSKPAAAKPQAQQQSVDDLLGSTGYSEAERTEALNDLLGSTGYSRQETSERNIEKADVAYNRIKDYKDKAALTEARRLYQQETVSPADAEHARNQIAKIDKLLSYKPPKGNLDVYRDKETYKYGFKEKDANRMILYEAKYDQIVADKDSMFFLCAINSKNKYTAELCNYRGDVISTKDFNSSFSIGVCPDKEHLWISHGISNEVINPDMRSDRTIGVSTYNLYTFHAGELIKTEKMVSGYSESIGGSLSLSIARTREEHIREEQAKKEWEEKCRIRNKEKRSIQERKINSLLSSGYIKQSSICSE